MQTLSEGIRLDDRYALIKRLGAGGMADLWLAQDERAGSRVALKFLKTSLLEQRELFRQEWRLASRLMHPHIVRVFEFYGDAERPYYALQYIDGPGLSDLAGEPLENLLPAMGLLADALRYAHGKDVVHRDIKADNVLVDQNGAPYLIDFGIASAASGGTPAGASPQQRAGEPPRSEDDIYALGVLLHELIAGAPPAADRPLTRANGESVDPRIANLVNAMLSDDPAARPSAEQVRDRLRDSGFAAAPIRLPARLRQARTDAVDEVRIESTRRAAEPAEQAPSSQSAGTVSRGMSPVFVYGSLAALLVVLLGVTFFLPDAVQRPAGDPAPVALEDAAETERTRAEGADTLEDDGDDAPSDAVADALVDVLPEDDVDGGSAGFAENLGRTSGNEGVQSKLAADEALGDLLSRLERLKTRGIERWGGQPYLDMLDVYAEGDQAYVNNNYPVAVTRYTRAAEMLEPFFDRIDDEFRQAMEAASAAFERRDAGEAVRLYDLAVAITPGNPEAEQGLERARKLDDVLDLMRQGEQFAEELALDAARLAYEKALQLDPLWEPAEVALEDIRARIQQTSFEARMSEGFAALANTELATARAAFNAAKAIYPDSPEPRDGLQQVDQALKLYRIREMEQAASEQVASEQWEAAVTTYEALLEVDKDLAFAQEGLAEARQRADLHQRLQAWIDAPDSLSDPVNMQQATQLMLNVSRMDEVGPRLEDHKETLARLLKRAATPVAIELVSDGVTQVSVYKVGKLGSFETHRLELPPGDYVAVGIRPGYRDVRREFRVAPELGLQQIVVQTEEAI